MNERAALPRQAWVDVFVAYVVGQVPGASASLLASAADVLYTRFGEYDPEQVAEAEWESLPLNKG